MLIFTKYPITRGMLAYAIVWPTGSYIQQKLAGQKEIDLKRISRFFVYGTFYVAPTLFVWVKFSSRIWPARNFRSAISKALIEQVTYGPFACASFFSIMTYMETLSVEKSVEEVKNKFIPTWKVGMCVWPVLQTVNFSLVPERNRVIYVACCSLMWTSFLAYMKYLEEHEGENQMPKITKA